MGNFGKYICMALFAFALSVGFAAVSEAAEPDIYAIQQQIDAKMAELDNELARDNPDRNKIQALSKQIGELRGQELSARAGQPRQNYYDYGPRRNYSGYGWHHGGHYRGGHYRGGCCW